MTEKNTPENDLEASQMIAAIQKISLEERLTLLSEKQRIYLQGYFDGILQVYKPLKSGAPQNGKPGIICGVL
ncbi:hypothetical protein AGMMS50293_13880 [Spirochaetia bacterium]|nr:hypothetical protein AGMMS50293_13880 [Spirochaetia bacterium]